MVRMEDRECVFHFLILLYTYVHADIQNSAKSSIYTERLPDTNDIILDIGHNDENCKWEQCKQLYQPGFLFIDILVIIYCKYTRTKETDEVSL